MKKIGILGHVTRIGEMRKAYKLFVGKPEGKRPLRRPKHRWVADIEGFNVFTALSPKMVEVYRCFTGHCCLHHRDYE